jgi:hypothetical protein
VLYLLVNKETMKTIVSFIIQSSVVDQFIMRLHGKALFFDYLIKVAYNFLGGSEVHVCL